MSFNEKVDLCGDVLVVLVVVLFLSTVFFFCIFVSGCWASFSLWVLFDLNVDCKIIEELIRKINGPL